MNEVRGIGGAALLFLASFALHIVGGATDQDWLFAIAVALIYFFATGFSWVATLLSGTRIRDTHRYFLLVTLLIALGLTWATLWATSDRSFKAWHALAGPGFVLAATAVLARAEAYWRQRG